MTIREAIEMLEHTAALNEAGLLSSSAAEDIKTRIGRRLGAGDSNLDLGTIVRETAKIVGGHNESM